jgi:hypothetical protein
LFCERLYSKVDFGRDILRLFRKIKQYGTGIFKPDRNINLIQAIQFQGGTDDEVFSIMRDVLKKTETILESSPEFADQLVARAALMCNADEVSVLKNLFVSPLCYVVFQLPSFTIGRTNQFRI